MPYVALKHLLADLALEAIRDPSRATWVGPLAAYGAAATAQQPSVRVEPSEDVNRLVEVGLLERLDDRISCRSAFLPHLAYLKTQTARLHEAVERLLSSPDPTGVPHDLVLGTALFNAGLFFEAHELLETTWRATKGPERDFYHGIVQAAAAFYHYEKRNMHGAQTLLGKSIRRLEPYTSPYIGVDVAGLRNSLTRWRDYFAGHETEAPAPAMPTIQCTGTRA